MKYSSLIGKYSDHGAVLEIMGDVNLFFKELKIRENVIRSHHVLHRCTDAHELLLALTSLIQSTKRLLKLNREQKLLTLKVPHFGVFPSTY